MPKPQYKVRKTQQNIMRIQIFRYVREILSFFSDIRD